MAGRLWERPAAAVILKIHAPCRFSHAKNSPYQSRLLRGFKIQWFSSGNQTRRDGTPSDFSVL